MSKEPENVEVVEEKPAFHCPVCGEPQTKFYRIKGDRYVYCPSCKSRIPAKKVPKEYRVTVTKEEFEKIMGAGEKKEDEVEVVEMEESKPKSEERAIERAKPPSPEEMMVEEMASELRRQLEMAPGINAKYIDWFIIYFKKTKTLQEDPRALYQALARFFPKADDEVLNFIVDTVFEIRRQYERKRGVFIPPYRGVGRDTLSILYPRYESDRLPPYRYQPHYTPYQEQYVPHAPQYAPYDRPITREEVQAMIMQLLEEKKRRDELDELKERYYMLEKKMSESLNQIVDKVNQQTERIVQQLVNLVQETRKEAVTKEELVKVLKEREKDAYMKYLEEKAKSADQIISKLLEERKSLEKRIEEMVREISTRQSVGDYKSDEFRLIAEGIHRIADIAEKRQPIKVIVESLPAILYPQVAESQRKPEKLPEAKETSSTLVEMLMEEGKEYVE